ncbi:helix-turn-helix domain-containing protein [Paenibacillus tyrfis]|uniref:helix-turn-helix domain-containing protein n=1 Tax=Paenibacillus tyrfis TaxID=1501230 RepID=UPI000B5954DE|nr:helix-turn-helix transcriptional regulator [Paenibacillus tyrfis]
MATFAEQIGAKIRMYRIEKNLTQEQLVESIGMAATYLGQIERGEKNTKLNTIEKIAYALDMSVYDLFLNEQEGHLQKKK